MELEEPIAININKKRLTENLEQSLQILQTWFSPSFPIGSYSFSHGLEALIEDKLIANKQDILDFLNCILFYGTCKNEIILIKYAYQGSDLNDFAFSLCPSKERKIESLEMGNAFRKILKDSWDYELPINTAYPICIGKAANHFQIPLNLTMISFLQSFISNLVNVCVKHIPIGQKIGQDCIVNSLKSVKKIVKKSDKYSLDDIGGICFNSDIYSIKHERLLTRVYKT
tara:strand:- start:134 stop:817 length:684 start_codon:yes stop_codon:yes gene_type:complete